MQVVQTLATVITLGLTISGEVATFGEQAQDALKSALRSACNCYEPGCLLTLRLRPASIAVSAILTIPEASGATDTSGGNSTDLAASVTAAASALVAQDPSAISSALGDAADFFFVVAAAPIEIATGRQVPLAVAPPPPPSLPGQLGGTQTEQTASQLASSSGLIAGLVAGSIAIALLVCSVVLFVYCKRRREKRPPGVVLSRTAGPRQTVEVEQSVDIGVEGIQIIDAPD